MRRQGRAGIGFGLAIAITMAGLMGGVSPAHAGNGNPTGAFDYNPSRPDTNNVRISGWAGDGDSPNTSISVKIYLNGVYNSTMLANVPRYWLGGALRDRHGFAKTFRIPPQETRICLTAVNIGPGTDTQFACKTVAAIPGPNPGTPGSPSGKIFSARRVQGPFVNEQVKVVGWAIDPDDRSKPIWVFLYFDGKYSSSAFANLAQGAIGDPPPFHRFEVQISLPPVSQVCGEAINFGVGTTTSIGCVPITVTPPIFG